MNFDSCPDRANTDAFKWKKYAGTDILPMWVADMEFTCAPSILSALRGEIDHGVLGYTLPSQHTGANQAVKHWLKQQHQWDVETDWIVWMPGVVPAFNAACKALCHAGDNVIVQTPNYPPLLAAPALHGLNRLTVDCVLEDGRFTLDFDALERHAALPETKLFILCNPMNPVGSVLTQAELDRVATICTAHDVVVCSDEIHCDLVLSENAKHLPAGNHSALHEHSITLMAASKTFNVAGLGAAFAIIPNRQLRARFNRASQGMIPWVNILGLVATEAAFTQAEQWHHEVLQYLRGNRDYLVKQINQIDGLSAVTPEATFLLWVEASGLGVNDTQAWCESRGVGPSPGADFGQASGFRINFGCPRAQLETAIRRLKNADEFAQAQQQSK
ncbi:MalY/PatB family protein [Alteromonas oceanisediminis]|uniref:MalY/PatB family protein n=1 Tax=Alteromonas oceanisediminis TaxID=2836180 RepID=UPI001BD9B195|nr:PatB family C-S lyase [Alteromonas oceanisediminis]MBT0585267.1 PatB family C-S lyase [Alteromonas oceanisediminis]